MSSNSRGEGVRYQRIAHTPVGKGGGKRGSATISFTLLEVVGEDERHLFSPLEVEVVLLSQGGGKNKERTRRGIVSF